MPKAKGASTTSNSTASLRPKRKRHPPSEERPIPKAKETVPLLSPHPNADSEAPSVPFTRYVYAFCQCYAFQLLQTVHNFYLVIMLIKPQGEQLLVGNM